MKYIDKKNSKKSQVTLVKLVTILGYEVSTIDALFHSPMYQHKGNLIWISVNKEGDCIIVEYEGKESFYNEITDYIRDNLPNIGGYQFHSNGSLADVIKTDYNESVFFAATNRNNRVLASFEVYKNEIDKIEGYATRLDFINLYVLDANALEQLYSYFEQQMEDFSLLQNCCFSYHAYQGSKDYSKELDFHPLSVKGDVYYKYWD